MRIFYEVLEVLVLLYYAAMVLAAGFGLMYGLMWCAVFLQRWLNA